MPYDAVPYRPCVQGHINSAANERTHLSCMCPMRAQLHNAAYLVHET